MCRVSNVSGCVGEGFEMFGCVYVGFCNVWDCECEGFVIVCVCVCVFEGFCNV